jgi:hypothetical protein
MSNLQLFDSSSDFVFKAIPFIYPTGFTVVMNCWFSSWDKDRKESFEDWMKDRLDKSTILSDHPLREKLTFLQCGCCLIFHSDIESEAWEVYEFFDDPDYYYVTFWEQGKITNENT